MVCCNHEEAQTLACLVELELPVTSHCQRQVVQKVVEVGGDLIFQVHFDPEVGVFRLEVEEGDPTAQEEGRGHVR